MVIDFHTHVRIMEVIDFVRGQARKGGRANPSWKSAAQMAADAKKARSPRSKHTNPKVRLRDMDKAGIDIQVLSMNLPAAVYQAGAADGRRMARACNEGIAEFVARAPDRFAGIGAVPMQDGAGAVREIDYAIGTLGLRGIAVLSNIAGHDLGEKRFWKFWARAEQLGVPVFIHPQGFTHPERLKKFFFTNTIGQPLEEALAIASLIHEGVLEAFPKLKISVGHGGGFLPYYSGRADLAYKRNKETRVNIKREPSAYMRRMYYDTVIFDRPMLSYLVGRMGA
ncbi:MAG: amidohydrolase family protein, partial [Rhodospirillales bacterium]|nr:amidohydrolase family protein [Rhodospirillales bacterium]